MLERCFDRLYIDHVGCDKVLGSQQLDFVVDQRMWVFVYNHEWLSFRQHQSNRFRLVFYSRIRLVVHIFRQRF